MVIHVVSLSIAALVHKKPVSVIPSMRIAVFRVACSLHRGATSSRSYTFFSCKGICVNVFTNLFIVGRSDIANKKDGRRLIYQSEHMSEFSCFVCHLSTFSYRFKFKIL
jgi:hypothetical protein